MGSVICDCCQRSVDHVRGSWWHGPDRICNECFMQWYDPDGEDINPTDRRSIGNYIRKKHGLVPLASKSETAGGAGRFSAETDEDPPDVELC